MKRPATKIAIGGVLAVVCFLLIAGALFFKLLWNDQHSMSDVPSPLIGKMAPAYDLPKLYHPDESVARDDMLGQPYLVNVFGSWCFACGEEHPVLMEYAKHLGVPLLGYNYKDKPADAKNWLQRHGSPYSLVITDESGLTAFDFGVYGAPETFLIDAKGIIQYKHIGPITPTLVQTVLKPKIDQLQAEARQ